MTHLHTTQHDSLAHIYTFALGIYIHTRTRSKCVPTCQCPHTCWRKCLLFDHLCVARKLPTPHWLAFVMTGCLRDWRMAESHVAMRYAALTMICLACACEGSPGCGCGRPLLLLHQGAHYPGDCGKWIGRQVVPVQRLRGDGDAADGRLYGARILRREVHPGRGGCNGRWQLVADGGWSSQFGHNHLLLFGVRSAISSLFDTSRQPRRPPILLSSAPAHIFVWFGPWFSYLCGGAAFPSRR